MKLIESLKIKEKAYVEKLTNGLTIIIVPRNTTNKKYVIWGTHFGSIDNHFIMPNTNEPNLEFVLTYYHYFYNMLENK